MNKLPQARTRDIVVQSLGKEILIYDLNTHKAYNLNETSSIVYQGCDGKTTFDELKHQSSFTDEIIFLALDELRRENLIEISQQYVSPFKGVSRREAIKQVGLASVIALPVISSLIAPRAAQAQSGLVEIVCTTPGGALCETVDDCVEVSYCQDFGCVCIANCCTGESVPPIEVL